MTFLVSTDLSPEFLAEVRRLGQENFLANRRYRPIPRQLEVAAAEAGLLFEFQLGCIYTFRLPDGTKLYESLDPEAAATWIQAKIDDLYRG